MLRLCCALLLGLSWVAGAQTETLSPRDYSETREPCHDYNPWRNAYFGDTHVHTYLSLDAGLQGTRTTPDQAYRFARGETLGLQPWTDGRPQRTLTLDRPLDFVALSDHAEFLGEKYICDTEGAAGHDSLLCRFYRWAPQKAFIVMNYRMSATPERRDDGTARPIERFGYCGENGKRCKQQAIHGWQELQQAAEAHYDRSADCRFTTFVGYEWSGSPKTENLHRNVIFRNARVPELPQSYLDGPDPEQLWDSLERECLEGRPGCDVLTIPHNSNLSAGRLFALQDSRGRPFTPEYARQRQRFEPLVEIFQHKGDSECGINSADELCGFEKMPYNNLIAGRYNGWLTDPPGDNNYVRHALKQGLALENTLGVNPFRYGIIASTDTHLGIPGAVNEARFPGHGGAGYSTRESLPEGFSDPVYYNPGGLAVVWATENSRDAIFDAMVRRETYGTSGPRIRLRLFAGWDYPDNLCDRPDAVRVGYARGVPMGGILDDRPGQAPPRLLVSALADPGSAHEPGMPLQRLQIVKGWVENGKPREKVFDVAGNPNNGAGVDPRTCETTGNGFRQLCRVWEDPDFDPDQQAFYYARAVENPSCRWSTRQCLAAGVQCDDPDSIPDGFEACCTDTWPKTQQERAWSSPVWYSP